MSKLLTKGSRVRIWTLKCPSFPPGQQPPLSPWSYDVAMSNPPLTLEFESYEYRSNRDEQRIEQVIQLAIIEAAGYDPGALVPQRNLEWRTDGAVLSLQPLAPIPPAPQKDFLTWGSWTSALIGINKFRNAYPHLNCEVAILVDLEMPYKIIRGVARLNDKGYTLNSAVQTE